MSRNLRDLKELRIARLALIKDRTRLRNRLQTLTLAFALEACCGYSDSGFP